MATKTAYTAPNWGNMPGRAAVFEAWLEGLEPGAQATAYDHQLAARLAVKGLGESGAKELLGMVYCLVRKKEVEHG